MTLSDSRMVIDIDGNVGVGTTSPSSFNSRGRNLVVNSDGDTGITISANSTSSSTLLFADAFAEYDHSNDSMAFSTSATEKMRIDSSGNVGIGTASPLADLTVATQMSSSRTSILYLDIDGTNTDGGGGEIVFSTSASSGDLTNYNAKVTGTRVSGDGGDSELGFWTTLVSDNVASQQRMVITKEGNVGIGTTNPGAKLEVVGSGTAAIFGDGTRAFKIYTDADEVSLLAEGSVPMKFYTSGAEKMRITSAGNVGIGTSSPASKLEVDGGDVEVSDSLNGLILKSPDGTRYRVTVANGGTLTVSAA